MPSFLLLAEATFPVTRASFHVHHRDDPKVVGLFRVNNRIRELSAEVPPSRWIKLVEALRVFACVVDESLHLAIKADPQIRLDLSVVTDGIGQLSVGLRMDDVTHRPAILRMRARDSSTGMP